MHAVIRTGGKQYYVTAGDILEVEKVEGNVGDTIALADVLLLAGNGDVTIGQPTVDGASVTAKITGQHRGQKIQVFRYRPKKRIRVRKGHRQYLTRLQIQSIRLADGTEYPVSAPAVTVVETPVTEAPVVETALVDTPVMATPVMEASVIDEPVVDEAEADEPVVDEAVVDEALADEPAADDASAATADAENKE
jgi:large subunit ribosomal protein L21